MILLKNCCIIDCYHKIPSQPSNILIEDDKILSISTNDFENLSAETAIIDLQNYYLLPGLIDNHVHVTAAQFDLANHLLAPEIITLQDTQFLEAMLNRGFTSVRDAGGATYGLKLAVEQGFIKGPRLFPSILALSQTGGHGDFLKQTEKADEHAYCHGGCSTISIVVDGVDAVRHAVREQIRQGATQIKIMASGGVASPTDNVNNVQYSEKEINAIVDEAEHAGTYVMAHAYAPSAIKRCINNGVRCIEHGNLIDEETASLIAKHNAYIVPTVVIYHAIAQIGKEEGFPDASINKVTKVLDSCLKAIEIAYSNSVKLGFGTDLLGTKAHLLQSEEFRLRAQGYETPHQIICSATSINAEILQQEGKLGVVREGAFADLIAVNANPLDDISVLCGQGENIHFIMKAGAVHKNLIN